MRIGVHIAGTPDRLGGWSCSKDTLSGQVNFGFEH